MERQSHGFDYQRRCVDKYHLVEEKNYTDENDAYTIENKPVQTKCIKKNSAIDLGDYFRNKSKKKDFILIIGFWENEESNIVEEYVFDINKEKWNSLFEYDFDEELKNDLSNISNNHSDDSKWKDIMRKHKSKWSDRKRITQLRFKRDHKSQKRIQCAINHSDFYNFFIRDFNGKKA